jgi:hypothetical protein
MNEHNTPGTGNSTRAEIVDADQLNDLYRHESDLYEQEAAASRRERQQRRRLRLLHRTLPGLTTAIVIGVGAGIALNTPGITFLAIGLLGTGIITGVPMHIRYVRNLRTITELREQNSSIYAAIRDIHTFTANELDDSDLAQIEQIFRAAEHNPGDQLGDTSRNCRDFDHRQTLRALFTSSHFGYSVSSLNDTDGPTVYTRIVRGVGADNLLIAARWPALTQRIAGTQPHNTVGDVVCAYRTAVDILRNCAAEHGDDTVTTAEQLTIDDTDENHHWDTLLNTAAALTH